MRLLWFEKINQTWGFPSDWQNQIRELSVREGQKIVLDGKHSTSRETDEFKGSSLRLTNGVKISEHIPWLVEAYENVFVELAEKLSGYKLEKSKDLGSAVVINHITGKSNGYERHVDSNPMTGLLFVNSLSKEMGGQLVFDFDDERFEVLPDAGVLLFFDAREVPHYVKPLLSHQDRLSIPMNFYFKDTTIEEINRIAPKEYAMGIIGNDEKKSD